MAFARTSKPAWLVPLLLLLLSACTSAVSDRNQLAGSKAGVVEESATSTVDLAALPLRPGPPEETTGGVPHIQTSATRNADLALELTRRAYSLPDLENRQSVTSLPGAQSFWLSNDLELARPEVPVAGREFGHIHPDSSMHLWLPVDRAIEVAENGWGERHPWAEREGFWDGVVMVWAPESDEDAAVSFQLIVDAFNFVTGQNLDASEFQ